MNDIPEWNMPKADGGAAAWRPIVEIALRACQCEGVIPSWKSKYEGLSLMTVQGGSVALYDLFDTLERLAERVDPATGAAR